MEGPKPATLGHLDRPATVADPPGRATSAGGLGQPRAMRVETMQAKSRDAGQPLHARALAPTGQHSPPSWLGYRVPVEGPTGGGWRSFDYLQGVN